MLILTVFLWTLSLSIFALVIDNVLSLARNIRHAKSSGLRYVVVPYFSYNRLVSRFMSLTFLKWANKLSPGPSPTSWRSLVSPVWPMKLLYAPFAALGTDTFLTVAPGGITMNTADADVVSQVLSRATDFPKPTKIYKNVEIYGTNVVSSEGQSWRYHRRLTSPAFSEKNNQLVWTETIDRTEAMLGSWLGPDGRGKTIHEVDRDTKRLSLEVIGRAGLGQRMEWPKSMGEDGMLDQEILPEGHTMGFTAAFHYITKNIVPVMMTMAMPEWLARNAPFDSWRKSYEAYDNWGRYMKEMISAKKTSILSGETKSTAVDLIGQLVKGQAGEWDGKVQGITKLNDSEVMGNLFIFILGGHETSASSIHFSLIFLALQPEIQRKVQDEVFDIFHDCPTSEWEFERDLPRLLNGFLGAVLNEELRLISPTITIPKITNSKRQHLVISNTEVTLPANMMMRLCIPAIHRNPHFWPSAATRNPNKPDCPIQRLDNDLEDFHPERWIKNTTAEELQWPHNLRNKDDNPQSPGLRGPPLYTPIKGSYIPFSDGQRACLGRRFAQVEILAALATIFSRYSVELAVDEWASDEEVARMTKDQRRECWTKARDKADWTWRNKMGCVITLQLSGAHVPLRFVRKGEERFMDL